MIDLSTTTRTFVFDIGKQKGVLPESGIKPFQSIHIAEEMYRFL